MWTIGYRSSLTEVVQIIGRATRDCEGKTHAQFTNLIAQPDAEDADVKDAVNNMLKAITLSLLMREVLAPNITFRPRSTMREGEELPPTVIVVDDSENPVSPRVREILESGGVDEIITRLMNTTEVINPAITQKLEPQEVTEIELPKIITEIFPDLPAEEISFLGDLAKTKLVISSSGGIILEDGNAEDAGQNNSEDHEGSTNNGARAFLRIGERLINVSQLDIDLIESVNPFQGAYEILSKSVTAPMLKTIQNYMTVQRSTMTEEEAILLWPEIRKFKAGFGKEPSQDSSSAFERRLAEALAFVRNKKAQRMTEQKG